MEGIFLVRASQWDLHAVYLRSQGFAVWATTGSSKKCPSGNDTGAVTLGSGAAWCKTSPEHTANFMSYKQRYTSCQENLGGLGIEQTVSLKSGPVWLVCLQASRTGGCDCRAADVPSVRVGEANTGR